MHHDGRPGEARTGIDQFTEQRAPVHPCWGSIKLHIAASFNAITIKVIDDGIGINAESIPSLFDFYTQAERSSGRRNGGLGLGLALVKSVIELHHGTINVVSDGEGLGSTFQATLPRRPNG
jgi:signal transduction histidine kinase